MRFTVLESAEKTIVVMDGRNSSALQAVIAAIAEFPHTRRSAIYSAEEDRRDEEIIEQGRLLGASFDHVILCEIEQGIDRIPGEVTRLLRLGVEAGERVGKITEVLDWTQAVDQGWRELQTGELLLIQSTKVSKTVKKLQSMLGLEPAETSV